LKKNAKLSLKSFTKNETYKKNAEKFTKKYFFLFPFQNIPFRFFYWAKRLSFVSIVIASRQAKQSGVLIFNGLLQASTFTTTAIYSWHGI